MARRKCSTIPISYLEAGKYIFNNCGDRLKLSLNESDEPDVVDSIPKPPWYVKGDSGYLNRELLDVFFLSNESGFFYLESGRSTFSSRLKYYITPNSTAKCDTLQYQAANTISLKTIAGCLKPKHFFGR